MDIKRLIGLYALKECFRTLGRPVQTRHLIEACLDGNFNSARNAIQKGADINTLSYMGRFSPGIGYTNSTYKSYVTPLILAATNGCFNSDNSAGYFKIVSLLLQQPDINLKLVARDIEIENGVRIIEEFNKSLKDILSSPNRNKGRQRGKIPFYSEQNYPIHDEMAHHIQSEIRQKQNLEVAQTISWKTRDSQQI